MLNEKEMKEILFPDEKEQIVAVLQGKCPHNQGWRYTGHGHNYDEYACSQCGETKEI